MKCAFIRSTLLVVTLILSLRVAFSQSIFVGSSKRVDRTARAADSIFIGEFLNSSKPEHYGMMALGKEMSGPNRVKVIEGIKGVTAPELNIYFETWYDNEFIPVLNKPYLFLTDRIHDNAATIITLLSANKPFIEQAKQLTTQPILPDSDMDIDFALRLSTAIFTGYITELITPFDINFPASAGCTFVVEKVLKGNIDPGSTLQFRIMPGETPPEPYIKYIFFVREEGDRQGEKWLDMIMPSGAATLAQLKQMMSPTPRTSSPRLKPAVAASIPGSSNNTGLGLRPIKWTISSYPWGAYSGAVPYYLAKIDQAKFVFSFDVPTPPGQIPAWWAQKYFGTTNVTPDQESPTGDGHTLLHEYLYERNPIDAYDGQLPNLIKISGDMQTGPTGGLLPAPLIVSVTDGQGLSLYIDTPVVFSVQSGGGSILSSSVATNSPTVTVNTRSSSQARAFFQLPGTPNSTNIITCAISSGTNTNSVSFTEYSDNGNTNNHYASPFDASDVRANYNDDGSIDVSWVNNTDPSDTNTTAIQYMDAKGVWRILTTAQPGQTSVHIPR